MAEIPLIRATHPDAFRSGEWARITGVIVSGFPCKGENGVSHMEQNVCFAVEFLDGASDIWPVGDKAAGYEFTPGGHRG